MNLAEGTGTCSNAQDSVFLIPEDHNSSKRLLIAVCSAPANFLARESIRQTWGKMMTVVNQTEATRSAVMFVVGSKGLSTNLTQKIAREHEKFGDILKVDFVDTYHNLTLKSLFMMKYWLEEEWKGVISRNSSVSELLFLENATSSNCLCSFLAGTSALSPEGGRRLLRQHGHVVEDPG